MKELLNYITEIFNTMLKGTIELSNAHIILGISSLLGVATLIIAIFRKYKG